MDTLEFVQDIQVSKPHKIKKATVIGDKTEGDIQMIMIKFDSINKALKAKFLGEEVQR